MRRLKLLTGGRPRTLDDQQVLQNLIDKSAGGLLAGRGNFIISGCGVSGGAIASGFIYIAGEVVEFPGASGLTFPVYLSLGAEVNDTELQYEDGNTKATQKYRPVTVGSSSPGGDYITVTATGGRTYFDAIAGDVVLTKGSQTIQGLKTFAEKIVSAGYNLVDEILAIKTDGWVTTSRIANASVTNDKLANDAVRTNHIAAAAIVSAHLENGTIVNSKLADGSVTTSKISDTAVTSNKIASEAVTLSKLATEVATKFAGNAVRSSSSVDFRVTGAAVGSKTYGNLSVPLTRADAYRLYIKMAFYIVRDSGSGEGVRVYLQRATNSSFTDAVIIATRYFKADGDTQVYCPVDMVDTGASSNGTYYYRLSCTNVEGTLNYFSNAYEAIAYAVPYTL